MSTVATVSGGPEKSIVASVLYRPGQAPINAPIDKLAQVVDAEKQLLWIGLKEPPTSLLEQIGAQLGFTSRAMEEISESHRRPKIIEYQQFTLIVAITVEVDTMRPIFGETQILIGEGFLITIRRGATATHLDLRKHLESCPEFLERGSDYVASAVLDLMVDRYAMALHQLETGVENMEQRFLLRGLANADVRRLYRHRRDLLRIQGAISPMAEICRRLSHVEMGHIDANCQGYYGEVADRVVRLNELITSLREALAFAFEAGLMIGQSHQTDITKKLAAWAAILAVPTAVAGIYGMNFKYMPELSWAYGYALIMAAMALVCGVLFWKFKKSGWL